MVCFKLVSWFGDLNLRSLNIQERYKDRIVPKMVVCKSLFGPVLMSVEMKTCFFWSCLLHREYTVQSSSPLFCHLAVMRQLMTLYGTDTQCLWIMFMWPPARLRVSLCITQHEMEVHQTQQAVCWLCHGDHKAVSQNKIFTLTVPANQLQFSKFTVIQQAFVMLCQTCCSTWTRVWVWLRDNLPQRKRLVSAGQWAGGTFTISFPFDGWGIHLILTYWFWHYSRLIQSETEIPLFCFCWYEVDVLNHFRITSMPGRCTATAGSAERLLKSDAKVSYMPPAGGLQKLTPCSKIWAKLKWLTATNCSWLDSRVGQH